MTWQLSGHIERALLLALLFVLLLSVGLSWRGNLILQRRDVLFEEFRHDHHQYLERQIRIEAKLDAMLLIKKDNGVKETK